jgi:hypothetical protein
MHKANFFANEKGPSSEAFVIVHGKNESICYLLLI